jgi:hypothetical protein
MFIKRILKVGLIAVIASALTTVQAQPAPKPEKEKPKKERPEKGGKKWDREKVQERLKAAFEKRRKNRGDAEKRGHKIKDSKKRGRGGAFGKLVRDDEKLKELRKAFDEVAKKQGPKFDRAAWKDASDDEKAALREKMAEGRKEWAEKVKAHRIEVSKRLKEIRKEFANKRDPVIDGNQPGE